MQELAKKFVGQECIVHTFDNNQIVGVLREVSEKGLLLERSGASEALNLDYVVRIREYPKKKNGRFDNNQIVGVLREVSEKGLLLERSGASEALNLDYVVRIREYPKKKNGRKKSIVMD